MLSILKARKLCYLRIFVLFMSDNYYAIEAIWLYLEISNISKSVDIVSELYTQTHTYTRFNINSPPLNP